MSDREIQKDIERIKERNARVEREKSWETSWTRRIVIALAIYIIAGIWLTSIEANDPWLNAVVPAAGFVLSTLSLPLIKQWWIHNIFRS